MLAHPNTKRFSLVRRVGEQHPGRHFVTLLESCQSPWLVVDVGGVDVYRAQQAEGVDDDLPLAANDSLGAVKATLPPFSVVFAVWESST